MNEKILEQRIEELEKRVADLEGQVQNQPINIDSISKKLSEKLDLISQP